MRPLKVHRVLADKRPAVNRLARFDAEVARSHNKIRLAVRSVPGLEFFIGEFHAMRDPDPRAKGNCKFRCPRLPMIAKDPVLRARLAQCIGWVSDWLASERFRGLYDVARAYLAARSWDEAEADQSGCPIAWRGRWRVLLKPKCLSVDLNRGEAPWREESLPVQWNPPVHFVITWAWHEERILPSGTRWAGVGCDPLVGYPFMAPEDKSDQELFREDDRAMILQRKLVGFRSKSKFMKASPGHFNVMRRRRATRTLDVIPTRNQEGL